MTALFDDKPTICPDCGLRVTAGYCPLGHKGPVRFDGDTYDEKQDKVRLTGQVAAVFEVMSSGRWWTLADLANEVTVRTGRHASEASVSARIRDLRKDRFGGHTVVRRRHQEKAGLWVYRMETA